jgi:pyruvate,water dikinase
LKTEIEKKKILYESYGQVSLPDRIIYTGDHMPNLSDTTILNNKQNKCLRGIPISKGDMKGEALVLDCPDFNCKVDDKILVTRTTDPGWIFLMAQAKGLISEKGSPLSHTAIVGRELGIPTIVNVEGAMTNIKNGNNIHMHAQTGLIEILN